MTSESNKILDLLTKEFLAKIEYTNPTNLGIYNALKFICENGNLWELKMLILIAEKEPVKIDGIVSKLESKISKSSIYRKISDYIDTGLLIKSPENSISLSNELQALSIIAKLSVKLNKK